MSTRKIITIEGPVVFGQRRDATITTVYHHRFATVEWTSAGLDNLALTTSAFRERLHRTNLGGKLLRWWRQHRGLLPAHSLKQGADSRGSLAGLPPELVGEVLDLIESSFRAAMENLPLVFSEDELTERIQALTHL